MTATCAVHSVLPLTAGQAPCLPTQCSPHAHCQQPLQPTSTLLVPYHLHSARQLIKTGTPSAPRVQQSRRCPPSTMNPQHVCSKAAVSSGPPPHWGQHCSVHNHYGFALHSTQRAHSAPLAIMTHDRPLTPQTIWPKLQTGCMLSSQAMPACRHQLPLASSSLATHAPHHIQLRIKQQNGTAYTLPNTLPKLVRMLLFRGSDRWSSRFWKGPSRVMVAWAP
mmetsp:Transcript_39031/g.86823  ORF Transcript_39031/g.86823 Transcript_39031/m.86823 type:complete len:221 (+) Transcript_39031:66-728(+)